MSQDLAQLEHHLEETRLEVNDLVDALNKSREAEAAGNDVQRLQKEEISVLSEYNGKLKSDMLTAQGGV